jgi:hypothetical protein
LWNRRLEGDVQITMREGMETLHAEIRSRHYRCSLALLDAETAGASLRLFCSPGIEHWGESFILPFK